MPENFENTDIRIFKTRKMLMSAMTRLLEKRNFNQITVIDLCEEAQVSRSTFYSHYRDKYDLLKSWLSDIEPKNANKVIKYEDIEKKINDFAENNKKIIGHLVEDANRETAELLCDFIQSLLDINIGKTTKSLMNQGDIVLSTVCCGGILNYLQWQVNNKFPVKLRVMNPYIFDVLLYYHKNLKAETVTQTDLAKRENPKL